MILTIEIKDSVADKVIYFLRHLKDDVTILERDEDINVEIIKEDDLDFAYIKNARVKREKGEKLYSLDEVIKEFE